MFSSSLNIKNIFKINFNDDFDGKFKYVKSASFLPDFLIGMLGLPPRKYDRRKSLYGRIPASPFFYITIPMIFTFGCVFFAVIAFFESFLSFFNTNVYLNGLIVSLAIFGVLKVFHNSYLIYLTAVFFRKMDRVVYKDEITPEDIDMLRMSHEKEGRLVNTISMAGALNNIEEFGHPNFSSQSARLIKSKFGFRVSKNRANVTFIAGILVMLGLLGTFLGLLGTIDAVGKAMDSMSNIGGDGGEVDLDDMTGFISSLSAPLQGMGLAFSSSLFGLSGSLLIGFFAYLGGTPQNLFIENMSRWIDNKEIKFDPKAKKDAKIKVAPDDQDLIEWFSGFMHMSVRTQKKLSQLSRSVDGSMAETQKAWNAIHELSQTQQALEISAKDLIAGLRLMHTQSEQSYKAIYKIAQSVDHISGNLDGMTGALSDLGTSLYDVNNVLKDSALKIIENNSIVGQHVDEIRGDIGKGLIQSQQIGDLITKSNEITYKNLKLQARGDKYISEILSLSEKSSETLTMVLNVLSEYKNAENSQSESFRQSFSELAQNQNALAQEIRSLLQRLDSDPHMVQAKDLVQQLNDVLSELNKKAKSLFSRGG